MPRLSRPIAMLALLAAALARASAGEVTLERVMADPEWIGRLPEKARWSSDGQAILFDRKMAGCDELEIVELSLVSGDERVVPDDRLGAAPEAGVRSADGRLEASVRAGDVWLEERETGALRQLTRTDDDESDPVFLADGRRLAFGRGERIFVVDLASGLEWLAADLRAEDDPGKPPESSFLRSEQDRLFDSVRNAESRLRDERQRESERRLADASSAAPRWYLGKDSTVRRSSLSPDGRHLLVVGGGKTDDDWKKGLMPVWVTTSGDVETREVRPKVGTGSHESQRLLLLDLATRESHELDPSVLPGIEDDPLKDLRAAAERRAKASQEATEADSKAKPSKKAKTDAKAETDDAPHASQAKARAVTIDDIAWNRLGTGVAVMLRAADNKDRWIATVDLAKGALVPLHRLHDDAWISWDGNEMGWLADGRLLWYLSEENGWSGIHVRDPLERRPRALTSGRQVASDVEPTRDGRWLYYRANPGNPGVFEIFRVETATGRIERVTDLGGLNQARLSPDEASLVVQHSGVDRPAELWVQSSAPGGIARLVHDARAAAFRDVAWTRPRLVDVPSSHGAGRSIHARLYLPEDSSQGPRPAVLFIHGAGYLQDAHEGWSGYFREFMFATILARRGFVVLDADYRGSAGYGRAWRTAIHRDMGRPEVEDLEDCVTWLSATQGVDASRVGAWGGSYGGFLVLMTMFREPDVLACGAALRPVTDWAHYNHPYTSDILETPELAPDAYRRSSPIEWAAGLRRPLLMCAPMLDDNVPFQDTVRLAQRLIELEKQDWEVAIYPVEPHTFKRPSSWLDEYRRILKLFEGNLR